MENRGFLHCCIQYVLKNVLSQIEVLEMGIPFCKNQGFPKLSPAMSQIGNTLSKTSVITIEYCGSGGPLEIFLLIFFLCDHLSIPCT